MHNGQWEVVILKPTRVFLTFLASQLPDVGLPSLNLLQSDTSAYVIPKHDDDEATLDEIEQHFPIMFRHEISRWLGKNNRSEIEGSFLDFLCCFKFELHSQIILMEPTIEKGEQLVCIKPRSVLLKWMKSSAVDEQGDASNVMERVKLSHLAENATVVIKNFVNIADVKPFINHYYRPLFKVEMLRMCSCPEQWPDVRNFQEFNRYFAVEIHTKLLHLC